MPLDHRELLRQLIAFNTVSDRGRGLAPTAEAPEYLQGILQNLGLMAEIMEHNDVFTVLARHGTGRPVVLFLAHFDTVPPGTGWKTDPFEMKVEGDRAYGRGTCDDKGNVVALLLLAERLSQAAPDCTVLIAATGDEEVGGANGAGHLRRLLSERDLLPDYVIVADAIREVIIHRRRNILPTVVKAHASKSTLRGRLNTVRFETDIFASESRHSAYLRPGVDRHCLLAASKYLDIHPEVVVADVRGAFVKSNVIPEYVELDLITPDDAGEELKYDETLTRIIQSLLPLSRASFPTKFSDKGTVICPNLLSLDDETGVWTVYLDVRAMTNDSDAVRDAFSKVLGVSDSLESLTVYSGAGYVDSPVDSPLIGAARSALVQVGIPVRLAEGFGASDSRHFATSGAQIFDFGPMGDNLHGPNEWVSLSSIVRTSRFYYELVRMLCSQSGLND